MTSTEEELKRLVPEFTPIMGNTRCHLVRNGVTFYFPIEVFQALVESRRTLERYRGALVTIRDHAWVENALDPQWSARIASEALKED